jgi:YidC/Oxa1 family membrane protein insertase
MILAIVLSALVLFGWTFISERYFRPPTAPATKIVDGKQIPQPKPGADPASDAPSAIRDRRIVLAEDSPGADRHPRARRLRQPARRADRRPPHEAPHPRHRGQLAADPALLPAGARDSYFANFGWTGEGLAAPGP